MATPKLNTGKAPLAPRRLPINSGTVPTKKVALKGADGKTFKPAVKKPAPKPTPDTAAEAAAAEAEAAAAAEAQAAAEAEAARLAEEEHARQMEEYNRQLEEYNRQMEEYNRQVAALAEAEAQATPEEAPAPETQEEAALKAVEEAQKLSNAAAAPAPAKKALTKKAPAGAKQVGALAGAPKPKAKPGAAKPGVPKPGAKKKSAPKSEEELAAEARNAYLTQLQADASQTPVWKRLPFIIGVGVLVAGAVICTVYVMKENAKTERVLAQRNYIKKVLKRAQDINQKGVETLADAKSKGVDVSCSKKDAKALLDVIVNPFAKGETGSNLYGNDPIRSVGYNSCLLLGVAAEADPEISTLVFDTMASKCDKIDDRLFKMLVQRVAIAGNNDVNTQLRKLADAVAAKPTWNKKPDILTSIWECIGLRVTKDDVPDILNLLKDESTDPKLAGQLCVCLDNVLRMMDNSQADEKAKIGDAIFESVDKKLLRSCGITIAKACSPKALEHYKAELADTASWKKGLGLPFIGYWGNDDILDYVLELQEKAKGDAQLENQITETIGTIFRQNRERSDADAERILTMYIPDAFADTSQLQDLINKTDPASALYVEAEAPQLMDQRKKLEAARTEKARVIKSLSTLYDYKWVLNLLERYAKDKDADIASSAKKAIDQVKENTIQEASLRDSYNQRTK